MSPTRRLLAGLTGRSHGDAHTPHQCLAGRRRPVLLVSVAGPHKKPPVRRRLQCPSAILALRPIVPLGWNQLELGAQGNETAGRCGTGGAARAVRPGRRVRGERRQLSAALQRPAMARDGPRSAKEVAAAQGNVGDRLRREGAAGERDPAIDRIDLDRCRRAVQRQ